MQRSLDSFKQASESFFDLEKVAEQSGGTTKLTKRNEKHMISLNFAIGVLNSLGRTKLEVYVTRGVIHNSTLDGGSLSIARSVSESYLLEGTRIFSADNYEQLGRICDSVHRVYERGLQPNTLLNEIAG